ncbi:MAG: hypothetical protein QOD84_2869 [Acidobacteriaceae bacterium]|jgi:tetratricopeptide (TPR) repeat protein
MTMARFSLILRLPLLACAVCASVLLPVVEARGSEPKWLRLDSAHFTVLTDAGEKKGHDVLLRFEQMRAAFGQLLLKDKPNMPQPLEIIALKNDTEYEKVAYPGSDGFFLPGEDRNYVVLNLFEDESWRAVAHQFAHLMLNYNYPPTQGWFDEGFAEYFSSLRLDSKRMEIGDDPELAAGLQQDVLGRVTERKNPLKSLTELLGSPVWLAMPDLFNMRHDTSGFRESTHSTLFYAQSWIVVHYLLNKNKLPQTGVYFDLVQNQKASAEQAITRAYGMTPAELDQAVKDYFHSLSPLFQALDAARTSASSRMSNEVYELPLPLASGDVGTSMHEVSAANATALLAEFDVRLPEHREQGLKDLAALITQSKTDSAIAHRALAWDYLQRKEFSQATEELEKAMDIDPKDPAVRYDLCLVKYHVAQAGGKQVQGLANMLQDLQIVIDWKPQFAEAYNLLAMARMDGGGANSAMTAERQAIALSPRNATYLLNLAHMEEAAKKWDLAKPLLETLKSNSDAQVARTARKDLENLPTLQKYGILPQESEATSALAGARGGTSPSTPESAASENDEVAEIKTKPVPSAPKPDRRSVRFLKGALVKVRCESPSTAVLTITTGSKSFLLRTENYKTLTLVGAEEFSCQWSDRPVSVNYKPGGKTDGDLVSLEIQ